MFARSINGQLVVGSIGTSPHFSHGKRREGPSAAGDSGSYSRSACPQADTSSGRHFDLNAPLPTTLKFAQQSSDRQLKSHRCEKCGLEDEPTVFSIGTGR